MKKIILSLVLLFGILFIGNIYGENSNKIERVSFYNSNVKSQFLGEKSSLIGLYMEPYYISQLDYKIEILKGKEFLEVIHTKGFRDYLKLKRITDKKYLGYNDVSIKITNEYDKEGYIYYGMVKIAQPILLISGELGVEGGKIQNKWKDIVISVEPNILKQTYKIDYIAGDSMLNFVSTPKMSTYEMSELNLTQPNMDILKHNYLNNPDKNTYYTYSNVIEPDFRKLINEQKKKEDRILFIKVDTDKAWLFFKEIDKYSGDNINIGKIKENLDKAEEVIIKLNKVLTDEEKETHTKNILYKINDVRKEIIKYENNLDKENVNKNILNIKTIVKKVNNNIEISNNEFKVFVKEYNKICKYKKLKEFDLNKISELSLIDDRPKPNKYKESTNIMFLKDKNNVYFNCEKIEGADSQTFKILNMFLVKDKNKIYISNIWQNKVYEVGKDIIDVKTFNVIDIFFSKDKNNVYYFSDGGLNIAKNIDSKTFISIKDRIGKDKNGCYGDIGEKPTKIDCSRFKVNINNDSKIKLIKQLIISKSKLKKNPKFLKFVPRFEKIIPKITDTKLLSIDKKIGSFSEKLRSNKKYKDIIDYLEAKIKLEIIKRKI